MPDFDRTAKLPADPRFTGACGANATAAVTEGSVAAAPEIPVATAAVVPAAIIEMMAIGTVHRVLSLKILLMVSNR
jgi:hypothetical protein